MFGWIILILLIVWGLSSISEANRNDGAFETFLTAIIWLIMGGGAIFFVTSSLKISNSYISPLSTSKYRQDKHIKQKTYHKERNGYFTF